jgi:hypothetical protein
MSTQIEQDVADLEAISMGDREASVRYASRLEASRAAVTVAPANPQRDAEINAETYLRSEYRDIVSDAGKMKQARACAQYLRENFPTLNELTCIDVIGDFVRRGCVGGYEELDMQAGRAEQIELTRNSRAPSNSRATVEQTFRENDDDGTAIARGRRKFGGMEAA